MKCWLLFAVAVLAVGCARSATIPIANDTVQISSSAAPICGSSGAKDFAVKQAAVETLRRGFDRFIVLGGGYQNNLAVVGHTPIQSYSSGSAQGTLYGNQINAYGQTTTTTYGGQPIIAGSHDQDLTIKMFREDDPAGANAVSARQVLGPEWQSIVSSGGKHTCF